MVFMSNKKQRKGITGIKNYIIYIPIKFIFELTKLNVLFFMISYIIIQIFLVLISINIGGLLEVGKTRTIIIIIYILIFVLIYKITGIKYIFTIKRLLVIK